MHPAVIIVACGAQIGLIEPLLVSLGQVEVLFPYFGMQQRAEALISESQVPDPARIRYTSHVHARIRDFGAAFKGLHSDTK